MCRWDWKRYLALNVETRIPITSPLLLNIGPPLFPGIMLASIQKWSKNLFSIAILPKVNEVLAPLVTILPLQLISYYAALHRDCDVDKPRNLAKSVTVE